VVDGEADGGLGMLVVRFAAVPCEEELPWRCRIDADLLDKVIASRRCSMMS